MSDLVEKVTDESLFEDYFNKFFLGKDCYIRAKDMNINVDSLTYEGDLIKASVQEDLTEGKIILFVRKEDLIIFSHSKYIDHEDHVYTLKPNEIQIMRMPRKEARKQIGSDDDKSKINISDIISEFVIHETLQREKKKIALLKEKMIEKLRGYLYSNIFFFEEKFKDVRMKYFFSDKRPLFIPHLQDDEFIEKNEKFYKFYRTEIYKSDRMLKWDIIVSEIAMPFMLKMMIPIGYIQVNHNDALTKEQFSDIRKLGSTFSELLTQKKIIVPSDDEILVIDISKSGLGLVFNQRNMIKHFKVGSYIYFSIHLPGNRNVPVYCIVRNINFIKNKLFRIGCEILDIDAIGEALYDEYLENS